MATTAHNLTDMYRHHERAVYSYFRRMGAQPADAADLAQLTFLRALQGVERFRGDSAIRTWLFGIARNVFREWLRSGRRATFPLDGHDDQTGIVDPDTLEVDEVLGRLERDVRELLVLHHVHGLTGPEIADLLGISAAAARQRLSRAAAEFRREWGER